MKRCEKNKNKEFMTSLKLAVFRVCHYIEGHIFRYDCMLVKSKSVENLIVFQSLISGSFSRLVELLHLRCLLPG